MISVWGTFGAGVQIKGHNRLPLSLVASRVVCAAVSVNEATRSTSNPSLLGEMQVHCRVPWHNSTTPLLSIYTPDKEKGTVTVKCLSQEPNTLINARIPTHTAWCRLVRLTLWVSKLGRSILTLIREVRKSQLDFVNLNFFYSVPNFSIFTALLILRLK